MKCRQPFTPNPCTAQVGSEGGEKCKHRLSINGFCEKCGLSIFDQTPEKTHDSLREEMLEEFLKELHLCVFVKSTNSVTDVVEELDAAVNDMEAIIEMRGEWDREDLKDILDKIHTSSRKEGYGAGMQKGLEMAVGCVPEEKKCENCKRPVDGKNRFYESVQCDNNTTGTDCWTEQDSDDIGFNDCRSQVLDALKGLQEK